MLLLHAVVDAVVDVAAHAVDDVAGVVDVGAADVFTSDEAVDVSD